MLIGEFWHGDVSTAGNRIEPQTVTFGTLNGLLIPLMGLLPP